MKTIIEHLTPFEERIPPEGTDLFVCEEKDTERRYGIMRFFRKGTLLPGPCCGGKTPEERLLEQIFHETSRGEYAPSTGFYEVERRPGSCRGKWVKSSINPLDASYIAIDPEDLE